MKRAKNIWDKKDGIYQPRISEEMVLREIVDRLWLHAKIKMWRVRERIPVKGKRWQQLSTPGIPDLVGWVTVARHIDYPSLEHIAQSVFIEVKRPGGVHRIVQEAFIDEAKAAGCIAFFAECWNDVVAEFAKYGITLKGEL